MSCSVLFHACTAQFYYFNGRIILKGFVSQWKRVSSLKYKIYTNTVWQDRICVLLCVTSNCTSDHHQEVVTHPVEVSWHTWCLRCKKLNLKSLSFLCSCGSRISCKGHTHHLQEPFFRHHSQIHHLDIIHGSFAECNKVNSRQIWQVGVDAVCWRLPGLRTFLQASPGRWNNDSHNFLCCFSGYPYSGTFVCN